MLMHRNTAMDLKNWRIFYLLEQEFVSTIKMAFVFGNSGTEVHIVTKDDEVLAFGPNANGCLGLENIKDIAIPTRIEELCGKKVAGFCSGYRPYVLAYTERGELYSWGYKCAVPTVIGNDLSEQVVVKVACGFNLSLALTKEGKVFTLGENIYNPQMVTSEIATKKCVSVACCYSSSFTVTDTGELYAWGSNENGELGLGDREERKDPCRVQFLSCKTCDVVVTRVVCGYAHTLALTDLGALYAWGVNNEGQLGTGDQVNALSPVLVAANVGRIVDIAATHSSNISAAITGNVKVYVWGSCNGKCVLSPVVTSFSSLHDIFAYIAKPRVTWQPIHFEEHVSEHFTEKFRQAFDDASTSDLIIKVEDKPIYVHKAILKICCQYFRSMFQEHWQEDKESVINIKEFSYTTYRAFLQYLYTEEVSLPLESCVELLKLASVYFEMKLMHRCVEIIKEGITVKNAVKLYSVAVKYKVKELEGVCVTFILNHLKQIVLSDEISEGILKDILLKGTKSGTLRKRFP